MSKTKVDSTCRSICMFINGSWWKKRTSLRSLHLDQSSSTVFFFCRMNTIRVYTSWIKKYRSSSCSLPSGWNPWNPCTRGSRSHTVSSIPWFPAFNLFRPMPLGAYDVQFLCSWATGSWTRKFVSLPAFMCSPSIASTSRNDTAGHWNK